MNAVGGNQQRAFVGARWPVRGAIDEVGANAIRRLAPVREMMAGQNVPCAQPLGRGIEQDLLQNAAVDRELRPFVAGVQSAWLTPDRLPALGEVGKFPGA